MARPPRPAAFATPRFQLLMEPKACLGMATESRLQQQHRGLGVVGGLYDAIHDAARRSLEQCLFLSSFCFGFDALMGLLIISEKV